MDRKTLIAVAVCVLLLLAYQPLLRMAGLGRYIDKPAPRPAATAVAPPPAGTGATPGATATLGSTTPAAGTGAGVTNAAKGGTRPSAAALPTEPERLYRIDTPFYVASFSNRGARLVSVELKRYATAHGLAGLEHQKIKVKRGDEVPAEARVVLTGEPLVALDLGSGAALQSLANRTFAVEESTDAAGAVRTLIFSLRDSAGMTMRQVWRARPDNYALDYQVEIAGVPAVARLSDYSLTLRSWPLVTEGNQHSDETSLRAANQLGSNIHRDHAQGLLKGAKSYDGNVVWASVQNRYFIAVTAIVDGASRGASSSAETRTLTPAQAQMLPANTKPEQNVAISSIRMSLSSETRNRFVFYVGPVEYFRLESLKLHLERAVDLGWTWVLPFSTVLLRVLNWLHALVRNYGLAILLLATLVRVVLHPLNMSSMKSQRALQMLQPEIERLRERFKNDAAAMNTAIMSLYKENKVNPAGGCLPMLAQMPLFLALYQVLFNAIELRQAPFFAWMTDLSAPDLLFSVAGLPVRLLPLVMAVTGLVSQMWTPMDPSQKPTMYLMNVFMLVFFYNLPSGLVLYWTVMNVLTAVQQWMVRNGDMKPAPAVVEVVSPAVKRRSGGR